LEPMSATSLPRAPRPPTPSPCSAPPPRPPAPRIRPPPVAAAPRRLRTRGTRLGPPPPAPRPLATTARAPSPVPAPVRVRAARPPGARSAGSRGGAPLAAPVAVGRGPGAVRAVGGGCVVWGVRRHNHRGQKKDYPLHNSQLRPAIAPCYRANCPAIRVKRRNCRN
jgi:hypothetical protein